MAERCDIPAEELAGRDCFAATNTLRLPPDGDAHGILESQFPKAWATPPVSPAED